MSVRTNEQCIWPTEKFDAVAAAAVRGFASTATADLRTMDGRVERLKAKALNAVPAPDALANANETADGGPAVNAAGSVGQYCVGAVGSVNKQVPNEGDLVIETRVIWFATGPDSWGGAAGATSHWRYF